MNVTLRRLLLGGTVCGLIALGTAGIALGQKPAGAGQKSAGKAKPEPPVKQPAALVPLERAYLKAKSSFAKKPKDKAAREEFIKRATVFGHESMVSPDLKANVKYRQALRLYREVLKLEPQHPVARPEHDLIVKIYEQMGRPVPK
ncbi:MAG: hypothetical protein SFX74_00220 [Fimbriimonadaceae bacterium]|nr:hypothetical protein [Fimbriimonadaceae bacterium]